MRNDLRKLSLNLRAGLTVVLFLVMSNVYADFEPEATGTVETLPAVYPDHWVLVHDFSFFHMFEGEVLVVDPLGESLGDQYKGMMTASFIAGFERNRARNEHYVIETFYSRGTRGGDRTDVVTIYDTATLAVIDEIEIPAKRISGMPKRMASGLLDEGRLLAIYNFTPAQSVTIVDLEKREFIAEVPTAGCSFVLPNGRRSFTSICSNGSLLTSHLNKRGEPTSTSKTEVLFDPDADPIFEAAAVTGEAAYFPTFAGRVLPIGTKGKSVKVGDTWWLTAEDERNWRPGGLNPVMVDAEGLGYFLMNPEGGEGTHKDGGAEVWVFDLAQGERVDRIELENWGISIGNSGKADQRYMYVTNTDMALDVYDLSAGGKYLRTLNTGAQTPFLVYGAQ